MSTFTSYRLSTNGFFQFIQKLKWFKNTLEVFSSVIIGFFHYFKYLSYILFCLTDTFRNEVSKMEKNVKTLARVSVFHIFFEISVNENFVNTLAKQQSLVTFIFWYSKKPPLIVYLKELI